MTPDIFNSSKVEIRDVNRNGTWIEWKCLSSLPGALESVNQSLIALRDEGKRINGRGVYGRDTLLTVVYHDQRKNPDPHYISFNPDGNLPIDLSLVAGPLKGWKPLSVEIDSSLLFVRFHLKKSKKLVVGVQNEPLDWRNAIVTGIDTYTRYNMSGPISDLLVATSSDVPSKNVVEQFLQKSLSIYP